MPFKFEKLEIWKLAIEFADEVHLLTPKEEMFSLTSQFKRATDSISFKYYGSMVQSHAKQKKFMAYSIRSLADCV